MAGLYWRPLVDLACLGPGETDGDRETQQPTEEVP